MNRDDFKGVLELAVKMASLVSTEENGPNISLIGYEHQVDMYGEDIVTLRIVGLEDENPE